MAAADPTKQPLVCHKCFIWSHDASECILLLWDLDQVIDNYEALPSAKRVDKTDASYLCSKKLFGGTEKDELVGFKNATF